MSISTVETPESPKATASTFLYEGTRIHMLLPSVEDHIAKTIMQGGKFYEDELLAALGQALEAGDLVVDVGANIGNHTVFFAKVKGCRVAAFEPNPDALSILRENIRLNGIDGQVEVFPCVVGSARAHAAKAGGLENNLGATRFAVDAGGDFEVRPLDDFKFEQRVVLLKVDVEGMDEAVLEGASGLIAKHRPLIVCEAETPEAYQAMEALLASHAYVGVGAFCATATYLFHPAATSAEREALLKHQASEIVRVQMMARESQKQLSKHKHTIDKLAHEIRQLVASVSANEAADKGAQGSIGSLQDRLSVLETLVKQAAPSFSTEKEGMLRLERLQLASETVGERIKALEGRDVERESRAGVLEARLATIQAAGESAQAEAEANAVRIEGLASDLQGRLEALASAQEDAGSSLKHEIEARIGGLDEALVAQREQALSALDAQRDAVAGHARSLDGLLEAVKELGERLEFESATLRASHQRQDVQNERFDRRLSEQVRLRGDLAADLATGSRQIETLQRELLLLRQRHDALLDGRIFGALRTLKAILRRLAWPLLYLMGRTGRQPTIEAAPAAPAVASQTRGATKPRTAPPAAPPAPEGRAVTRGATPAPAKPVAGGGEIPVELVDIPYMRRPRRRLSRDFLEHPIAANALVSVVMTTFNSGEYLRPAIESILRQTHSELELIVVDDCSSDATRQVVEEIASSDPRVRLFSFGANRGTYWCKNLGITKARGEAITFMDSDDVSEPERIGKQLELLRVPGTAVTTCLHERRDLEGNLVAVNGRTKRLAYISQMMRRDVFAEIGYFDSVRTSADDEMLRRIKRVFGDPAHQCVHEVLYKALVHGASLTQDPANKGVSSTPGGLSAPRQAYSKAVDAWHAALEKKGAYPFVPFPVVRRPFAVHDKLKVERGAVREDMISVCVASFPPRRNSLKATVASLIDQVDRIFVYLNEYDAAPDFLDHPRITVRVGGPDLRDNGKFAFSSEIPEGYVFTVDDDIVYPPDYVQALVRKLELYGRKAMVGLHGTNFAKPLVSYFADRELFHFKYPLERDRIVNQLGTGTLAFHTSLWRPSCESFESTGMVDAWIAVLAARRGISLVAVERARNWLRPMEMGAGNASLFDEYRAQDEVQTALVKTVERWHESPGPALSRILVERIAAAGQAYRNLVLQEAPLEEDTAGTEGAPVAHADAGKGASALAGAERHAIRGCIVLDGAVEPERLASFAASIADQLDELCVVVGEGMALPPALSALRSVRVVPGGGAGGLLRAAAGHKGYLLPLDARIEYPRSYVRSLVDAVDRYGRRAVVGWLGHGQDDAGDGTSDRQVDVLAVPLAALHAGSVPLEDDLAAEGSPAAVLATICRKRGVPLVELGSESTADARQRLREAYRLAGGEALDAVGVVRSSRPVLVPPYMRAGFRLAVVGRTDRKRWKKGGILKSTHLTAEMLEPYGVEVLLVDIETGDPKTLDGGDADIVMIYPGDPERPDFVNVLEMVDHHARAGRAVLVNLSLNNRASRKKFIREQMESWRSQYGNRVAMMAFSDRVRDDEALASIVDMIVAIPKTLQVIEAPEADFFSRRGIFLGDYGKLCDESLLAWPAEDVIAELRRSVPGAPLFAVQQYRPKVRRDLGIEVLPFLTDDYSEVLAGARLMVSPVKFATFEMVPIEVAALGVPLLHAKMENSISDYLGLGAIEVESLAQLGLMADVVYNDPLCWSDLSRAGELISHGLDYHNMSSQMYLRLLQFLRTSGARAGSG